MLNFSPKIRLGMLINVMLIKKKKKKKRGGGGVKSALYSAGDNVWFNYRYGGKNQKNVPEWENL